MAVSRTERESNSIHSRQYRSTHRRCSIRKGVLRNFAKFTGKHLCQSLFLIKLQAKNTFFTEHLQATTSESKVCSVIKIFTAVKSNLVLGINLFTRSNQIAKLIY